MPSPTIRTFIAISIPITTSLRELRTNLIRRNVGAPLEKEEQSHITLKFVGETPSEQLSEITRQMEDVAQCAAPFELALRGIGAFPDVRRPSVLWIGVQNREPLAVLARELDVRLEPLGFIPEQRSYKPHLTVTRFRSRPPEFIFKLLEQESETDFGTVAVREIELFQSELLPSGPRYTSLARAELGH